MLVSSIRIRTVDKKEEMGAGARFQDLREISQDQIFTHRSSKKVLSERRIWR